eukprot:Tamp_22014.p1 GENE.Tamp_22014~~Tamp_22014.p1  ORF type:complete len:257 (-),score=51.55 Tamp_22014:342-1013(-)
MAEGASSPLNSVAGIFKSAATGLTRVIAPSGRPARSAPQRASELSAELKKLLLQGLGGQDFDRASIDALISELTAIGSRVDGALLSSGPWQAVYTKNSQPLWEKQAKYIPFIKNRAWQDYDLQAGRVENVGQILGDKVWVSVQGSVSEQSTSKQTPKYYNADIQRGALNVLGVAVPLPIQGKGVAKLLYQDANLRVFESPKESESEWETEGLVVVQMPIASVP